MCYRKLFAQRCRRFAVLFYGLHFIRLLVDMRFVLQADISFLSLSLIKIFI